VGPQVITFYRPLETPKWILRYLRGKIKWEIYKIYKQHVMTKKDTLQAVEAFTSLNKF